MTAFDTNVLIYSCAPADRNRQEKALELITSATDGVLPWQVACEFIAASRKLSAQGFTSQGCVGPVSGFLVAASTGDAFRFSFRSGS